MAKDPAFLFYPGDFNTGTQFFSDEQVGKYMRLLMAQHQHGHLTEDQVKFICKSYDNQVMSKFKKDSAGLWYNERLEIEVIKRKKFVESRSKNKSGKTKEKNTSFSYDNHMENENEIIIGINNTLVLRKEIEDAIFNDKMFVDELVRMNPGKDIRKAWDECYMYHSSKPTKLHDWEWRQKLGTWLIKFKAEEKTRQPKFQQ